MKKLLDVLGALAFFGVQAFYFMDAFEQHKRRKRTREEEEEQRYYQRKRNAFLEDIAASLSAQLSFEQRKTKVDILKERYGIRVDPADYPQA